MATFRGEVGVRQTGDNTGPRVNQYLAAVGLDPGYAWCGAFVGWGYREHDLPIPSGAAWSPSWFPQSKQIRNQDIEPGDVGGIYFNSLGRIGHVFVYDKPWDSQRNMVVTIEGNTNDTGSRTGHSVLRKYRDKNQISKSARWIPEQT